VLKSDGSHEKRTVKTGESDTKSVEILEGLSEGDKDLAEKSGTVIAKGSPLFAPKPGSNIFLREL